MTLKENLLQMGSFMRWAKPEGFVYGSLYEYFAMKGAPSPASKAAHSVRKEIWKEVASISPKIKQCFYNAQQLALFKKGYVYFEGFVTTDIGFPIHHGWCVTDSGILVDPTLRINHNKRFTMNNCVIGEPPAGWEYHGRWFPNSAIEKMWRETEEAGSLVDDWRNRWPLLKEA